MTNFSVLFVIFIYFVSLSHSSTYTNPVIPNLDTPDPGVIQYDGYYYATTTSGDANNSFPIWKSVDLVNWQRVGYVFPDGTQPSWSVQDYWAPEIHRIGNSTFNVYFAARDTTGLLCVGAATSNNIEGPYTDIGKPLVRTPGMGNIDPTSFIDKKGNRYLYWKADGNAIGKPTPIYSQKMLPSGLAFASLSFPVELFRNTLPWEGAVVEAPWVVYYEKEYFIFYSGNSYVNGSYAVGVAKGPGPVGPFTKFAEPILVTDKNSDWIGPGHCSVIQVGTNSSIWYMIYHAWPPAMQYRNMMIDQVYWDSNGPYMGNGGTPSYEPMPYPPMISESQNVVDFYGSSKNTHQIPVTLN